MKPMLICPKKVSLSPWAENKVFGCMRGWAQQVVTQQEFIPWDIVIIFTCKERTNEYHFQTSIRLNTRIRNAPTYIILKEIQWGFDSMWAISIDLLSLNVSHTYLLSIFMFIKCVPKPFRIKSTIVPRAPAKDSQWEGLSLLFRRL